MVPVGLDHLRASLNKQGLAIRRGTGRAVAATAHKILRIAFAMLRDGQPYRDPQVYYQARTRDQEQGALAEDVAQGQPVAGGRARGCQTGRRLAGWVPRGAETSAR